MDNWLSHTRAKLMKYPTDFQRAVLATIDHLRDNAANAAYTTFSGHDYFAIISRDYLAQLLDCQIELEEIKARPEMADYQRFPDD